MAELDRLRLADAFEIQMFGPGAIIMRQGELPDAFYVIEEGSVVVMRDGKEVNRLGKGDVAFFLVPRGLGL